MAPRSKSAAPATPTQRARTSTRVKNMQVTGQGQGGSGDRTAASSVPWYNQNPETFTNPIERWRQYVIMYMTSWEARKIVNIPVDDALRKPFTLKGISEASASHIKRRFDRLQLIPILKRSLKLERLLGGCLTFMGLESDEDEPSKKYSPKSEKAKLRFINSIPVSRISRMHWDTNPLSENYMRPDSFFINNVEVHVSRCLLWDGDPLFDPNDFALTQYRANLAGFGPSVLGCLWDDVIMACGTRQAAYQLIQINGAIIAAIQDLQDISGAVPGQKNLAKIQQMVNQLSAFRAAIVDGDKVQISQHSASFGSVPELLITYLQVLSAASDIPATRFLGQAPGGLNATGDSDLENYYNSIDSMQTEHITPQLIRLIDVIGYAEIPTWNQERDKLEVEWPPLWNETATEQADRAGKTIDYVLKLVEAALMGDDKAVEEINSRGILSVKLDVEDLALLQAARDEQDKLEADQVDAQAEIAKLMNTNPVSVGSFTRDGNPGKRYMAQVAGYTEYFDSLDQLRTWAKSRGKKGDVLRIWDTTQRMTGTPHKQLAIENMHHLVDFDELIRAAGADPDTVGLIDFELGWKAEQEHRSSVAQDTEPNDDLQLTRIVLDHLAEDEEYYQKLSKIENALELSHHGDPTDSQIAAGNYRKHHIRLHGLDIAIENPKGSIRRGRDPKTLKIWESVLPAHYGYVKRTTGADGDHVDVYVGEYDESPFVFIVNQVDCETGIFDEHKCILGCHEAHEARNLYLSGFSDGMAHRRLGGMYQLSIDQFKGWLANGDTTAPYGGN